MGPASEVTKDKTECTKTHKQASNEAGFSKDLGEHLKEGHKEGSLERVFSTLGSH